MGFREDLFNSIPDCLEAWKKIAGRKVINMLLKKKLVICRFQWCDKSRMKYKYSNFTELKGRFRELRVVWGERVRIFSYSRKNHVYIIFSLK